MDHAFRCKNCGRLHRAEAAGEQSHPAACEVCGSGVLFGPSLDALLAEHEELRDTPREELEAGLVRLPFGVKLVLPPAMVWEDTTDSQDRPAAARKNKGGRAVAVAAADGLRTEDK